MIYNLFPTPVGFYKLERKLLTKELSFIKKQQTYKNSLNTTSQNTYILQKKELVDLKNFFENCIADYLKTVYDPKYDVNLQITQSWCNYTEKGQSHHKHAHANSFVSGVFYFQANEEVDKIYFYNEIYRTIELPPKNWNEWNSSSWWFPVNTGQLFIFPSYLSHSVEPTQGLETRISLSFNTFPVGNMGNSLNLTELKIKNLG